MTVARYGLPIESRVTECIQLIFSLHQQYVNRVGLRREIGESKRKIIWFTLTISKFADQLDHMSFDILLVIQKYLGTDLRSGEALLLNITLLQTRETVLLTQIHDLENSAVKALQIIQSQALQVDSEDLHTLYRDSAQEVDYMQTGILSDSVYHTQAAQIRTDIYDILVNTSSIFGNNDSALHFIRGSPHYVDWYPF